LEWLEWLESQGLHYRGPNLCRSPSIYLISVICWIYNWRLQIYISNHRYIYMYIGISNYIYIYIQSYRDSNHHYNRKLRLTQNGLVPISNILLSSASLKGRSNRTPLSWISLRSQTWVCLEIGYIGYIPQWNSRFMWRKWVFFRVLIQWTQWGTLFSDKPTSQEWTQCEDFTLVLLCLQEMVLSLASCMKAMVGPKTTLW
jgi:hypothetical protein